MPGSAQHRPGGSCELVGERDDDDVAVGSRQQAAQPVAERGRAPRQGWQRPVGSVDEQHAQVFASKCGRAWWVAWVRRRWCVALLSAEPGAEVAPSLNALTFPTASAVAIIARRYRGSSQGAAQENGSGGIAGASSARQHAGRLRQDATTLELGASREPIAAPCDPSWSSRRSWIRGLDEDHSGSDCKSLSDKSAERG